MSSRFAFSQCDFWEIRSTSIATCGMARGSPRVHFSINSSSPQCKLLKRSSWLNTRLLSYWLFNPQQQSRARLVSLESWIVQLCYFLRLHSTLLLLSAGTFADLIFFFFFFSGRMTANLFMAADCEMGKFVRPCRETGSTDSLFPI